VKKFLAHRFTLGVEILLTLAVCCLVILFSLRQLQRDAAVFNNSVNREYGYIMDGYTTAFDSLCLYVADKLQDNLPPAAMMAWQQSKTSAFKKAIGANIFDDFYYTYKGTFIHSWPHGDYSRYVPSSRGWYQAAQKAGGETTIIPPYTAYTDKAIIMSVAKKYNEEVYFGMDLKVLPLNNLLLNRNYYYPNHWLILANTRGDVLSSNQPPLLRHNLFKTDENISASLSAAIRGAQALNGRLKFTGIDGSYMLAYVFANNNDTVVCFLMPFWLFFREYLAPILVVGLILILLEILVNIISRRRLREASAVDAAKSDFLSRMSHDIRTPLNGVIGMTKLAREENTNPVVADYLRKIDISSHYLLGLVNDILDLSKISAGKMELHPEPYQEQDFLQYLESIILPMCAAKQQHFSADNYHFKHNILVDRLKVQPDLF
jgi:hypothetical protein